MKDRSERPVQQRERERRRPRVSDEGERSVDVAELEVECPFCHSNEVEFFSLFGSQLLTSEYYCRNCHTVFEQVKR